MDSPAQPVERALIIGWGFIGASLGMRLVSEGASVVGLTRSETNRSLSARARGVRVEVGNACDPAVLARCLEGVNHVVVAAGGLPPPAAADAPVDDAVQTLAPLITTLEAVRHHSGISVTYLSSGGTVYGNPERLPARETDSTRPMSPYGASRLAGEIYAAAYSRAHGLPVRVVRCANVYGPDQPHDRNQGAVAVFLQRVSTGAPVSIVGDGSARRDYVHSDDVSSAMARLLIQRTDFDILNIGSGKSHSVMELVEAVSRVVGRPAALAFQPSRPQDVDEIVLDITKIQSLIAYTPMPLDEGLLKTWRALKQDGWTSESITSRLS